MTDEMISASDPYEAVLGDLRAKRDEYDRLIRSLEAVRGIAGTQGPSNAARPTPDPKDGPSSSDFLGMSIAEAARKFLAVKRRTMNSGEIAAGLQAGGFPMTATDPANVIGSVLTRRFNSVGDIVRVSRGQWGLAEWYPNRSFKKKINGKIVESTVLGVQETDSANGMPEIEYDNA
jgi:hypothetical protein